MGLSHTPRTLISQFLKLFNSSRLPHLFRGISWHDLTCGMRSQPRALRSGFVSGPHSIHDHTAGHNRSRSGDRRIPSAPGCAGVGMQMRKQRHHLLQRVHEPGKSGVTALTSQPCCLGKSSESGTSGEEQKCFAPSIGAEISGG